MNPASLAATLSPRQRFRAWWEARLPLTDRWALGQRNIYILPTRAGLAFALTLVVMLLASINYQLSLGYALTFLLAGTGLVSMHLTHGNLRGLTLHLKPVASNFAGQPAKLEVVLHNPGRERHGLALRFDDRLRNGRHLALCDAPAGGQAQARLSFTPPQRGWHRVPALVLETDYPFGLFRAWSVWRPAGRVRAWPAPEVAPPPLPAHGAAAGDERAARRRSGSELDGVRPFRRGDSLRQLAWKKVAASGELVSRETAGLASRSLWLDWAETGTADVESRLSRLAAWVLQAERSGIDCGLRLPGHELPPRQGEAHRRAALDLLAEWSSR
ncbi:MAG: DUF58 domain-containing protein [Ideonella sp. WA131b]|jgi:uncharacterized protein (DUF58 family)|nr:DUF58 domain-containing protein [Ideonella sp. WA131b]